jgi:hypothetical protein
LGCIGVDACVMWRAAFAVRRCTACMLSTSSQRPIARVALIEQRDTSFAIIGARARTRLGKAAFSSTSVGSSG